MSTLLRFFSKRNLLNFFINNSHTLFKGSEQSLALSLTSIALYIYNVCFVFLSENYLNLFSETGNYTSTLLAMNAYQTKFAKHLATLVACVAVNGTAILLSILYYTYYSFKPFKNARNTLLSSVLQNYYTVFFVPVAYVSLMNESVLGKVNFALSILIGGKHSFHVTDHLAKRSNSFHAIQVTLVSMALVLRYATTEQYVHLLIVGVSAFSLLETWIILPYLDVRIERIEFQLNCMAFIWNGFVYIAANTHLKGVAIGLTCFPIIALTIGGRIYDYRRNQIDGIFVGRSIQLIKFKSSIQPWMVVQHVRAISINHGKFQLKEYISSDRQPFYEDIILQHVENCLARPYCFCQSALNVEDRFDYVIGDTMRMQFHNNYVMTLYEKYMEQNKKFDEVYISYLLYLLEGMKNTCLAFSKCAQFLQVHASTLSFEHLATLSEIQQRMMSDVSGNTINQVIEFDEQLYALHEEMSLCIYSKGLFLAEISKDYIDLLAVEKIGIGFIGMREKAEVQMEMLYQKNRHNYFLQILVQIYLLTLSFSDSKLWFEKNRLGASLLHKNHMISVEKELLYSKKSIAVFASVQKDKFGKMQKVSKNIEPILGYLKEEVLNQNVAVFMTKNLGEFHNNLIWRFLKRGHLVPELISRINPLIAKKKSGFLIPIMIQLQIGYAGSQDIGLSCLITAKKSLNEYFIGIDMHSIGYQLRFDGFSENIFHRLFQPICNFSRSEEYYLIKGNRIFPLLPFLIASLLEGQNTTGGAHKTKTIEMIGFFPVNSRRLLIKSKKNQFNEPTTLDEYRNALLSTMQKGRFSASSNIYMNFSLTVTYLREESLEYCHIQINGFTEISAADNLPKLVSHQLQREFANFGGLSLTNQQIEECFNIQQLQRFKHLQTTSLHYNQNHRRNYSSHHHLFGSSSVLLHGIQTEHSSFPLSIHRGVPNKSSTTAITEVEGENQGLSHAKATESIAKRRLKSITNPSQMHHQSIHSTSQRPLNQQLSFSGAGFTCHNNYNSILGEDNKQPIISEGENGIIMNLAKKSLISRDQLAHSSQNNNYNTNKQNNDGYFSTSMVEIFTQQMQEETHPTKEAEVGSNIVNNQYTNNMKSQMEMLFFNSNTHIFTDNHDSFLQQQPQLSPSVILSPSAILSTSTMMPARATIGAITTIPTSEEKRGLLKSTMRKQHQQQQQMRQSPDDDMVSSLTETIYVPIETRLHSEGIVERHDEQETMSTISQDVQQSMNSTISNEINLSQEIQSLKDLSLSATSKGSYDKALKKTVMHQIETSAYPLGFLIMKIVSMVSLGAVMLVVIVIYINLNHDFDKQMKDFYYIPWGIKMRTSISRMVKDKALYVFTDYPMFAGSLTDVSTVRTEVSASMISISDFFLDNYNQIFSESREDLVLKSHLYNSNVTLSLFLWSGAKKIIYPTLQYGVMMYTEALFLYSHVMNDSFNLIQSFIGQNFPNFASYFATSQKLQENSVTTGFNAIKQRVVALLGVISGVCGCFVLTVLVTYAYKQKNKERILRLFANIEPNKIIEMNIALVTSYDLLFSGKTKDLLAVGLKKTVQKSKQDRLPYLNRKKKLTSPTNDLPLGKISLYISSCFMLGILLIYPIANLITTIEMIAQSNSNQSLTGTLQTIKGQVSSNIASYSTTMQSKVLKDSMYAWNRSRYYSVMGSNSAAISYFQGNITKQEEVSRYRSDVYADFLFTTMKGDACATFAKYFDQFNIQAGKSFSYENCQEYFAGDLKTGLMTTIQKFINVFQDFYEIDKVADETLWNERITAYFMNLNYFEINRMYEMIALMLETLTTFIYEMNKEFFDLMVTIQTWLMVYQFIVLVFTYKFALLRFIDYIQKDLFATKRILSIFEAKYLYENSYILNYLKR